MSLSSEKVAQIQSKTHFWIAFVKTFRVMYTSIGFSEVRIFHCFGWWHHSILLGFEIRIFCGTQGRPSAWRFQRSKLSVPNFTEGDETRWFYHESETNWQPIRFNFNVEFCRPILSYNNIFCLHHFNLRSLYLQPPQSLPNWIQLYTAETSPAVST